jgi:hypothetical protein
MDPARATLIGAEIPRIMIVKAIIVEIFFIPSSILSKESQDYFI